MNNSSHNGSNDQRNTSQQKSKRNKGYPYKQLTKREKEKNECRKGS